MGQGMVLTSMDHNFLSPIFRLNIFLFLKVKYNWENR